MSTNTSLALTTLNAQAALAPTDTSEISKLKAQIQELQNAVSKWRDKATRDTLTGCLRREGLMDILETRRAMGWLPQYCTLVVVDADHFKRINDTWGHHVGDQVLSHLGKHLREAHLPEGTLVARTGGEEFVLIIPTRKGETLNQVEKLREEIASTAVGLTESRLKNLYITVSLGLVEWDTDRSLVEAAARADELLYRAKAEGRNRLAA